MRFRRFLAILLVMISLMAMIGGCKSKPSEEEGAFDAFVENKEQENSEQLPDEKEEETPKEENKPSETPKEEESVNDQKPEEQKPEEQKPEEQKPEEQKPEEQKPEEQKPEEQKPEEQKPAQKPDAEVKPEYNEANHLKILGYNIRCGEDNKGNDGSGLMLKDRADRLKLLIDEYDPDLMGFQEAVPEWIDYIQMNFTMKYELRYKWRAESSLECTPILWKRDKFDLVDEGYYWISETPDEESKGWGTKHYRVCQWVVLKIKATGKQFMFTSLHLTAGKPAVNSAPLLVKRAKPVGGITKMPYIIAGDFNSTADTDAYKSYTKNGFVDINNALGFDPTYTNNGYHRKADDDPTNVIRDYVFYGGAEYVIPLEYEVLDREYNNGWISDHRGIWAELALKD